MTPGSHNILVYSDWGSQNILGKNDWGSRFIGESKFTATPVDIGTSIMTKNENPEIKDSSVFFSVIGDSTGSTEEIFQICKLIEDDSFMTPQ